jgi:peptidoglycan/LPS O-acetylase OafA/YrhL
VVLVLSLSVDGVGEWVANLLFLPAIGVDEPYLVTQAWAIGVEVTFYLVLPLFALATGRFVSRQPEGRRSAALLVWVGGLFVVGAGFRLAVVVLEPGWAERSLLWLPMYLDFFAVGMALAVVSADVEHRGWLRDRLVSVAAHPALCWTTAAVILALVAQAEAPPEPFGLAQGEYLLRQFGYGLACLVWLVPGLFGEPTGRLRGALQSTVVVRLGVISYGFYLWHLAFIEKAKQWTVPDYSELTGLAVFQGNMALVSAIAFGCTVVVAGAVFYGVEVPALRLKDRPLRGRHRSGQGVGSP